MSGRSLTQKQATKAKRVAQIAAAGCGVLALAAMFSRLPGVREAPAGPGPITWPEVREHPDAQGEKPRASADWSASASRLSLVANKPKAAPPPTEPTEVSNTEATAPSEVRYLGAVLEPTRRVALIRVGDKQRMIAEGGSISLAEGGTLEVLSVEAEGVTIRDGLGERRIEKAARSVSPVTTITDNASGAGVAAAPAASDGAPESRVNEEMQRRSAEAQARIKAMRDRARAGGPKP